MSIPAPATRALECLRADPVTTRRIVPDPVVAATRGSVLLSIERFVVTSNNVTYALNGDNLGYWSAFPASEPEWGRVPAWGVARVVGGDDSLASPGEVFVGFLPMATHVVMAAERTAGRLTATAPHRLRLAPLYRRLDLVDRVDDLTAALLPMRRTPAHLDDELRAGGSRQVVFSSATSRTALATAVLLRQAGTRVAGLTAETRTGTAARADVYDQVLSYDDVSLLDRMPGTVYADVAGRPEVTAAVHRHLGSALVRSVRIGGSHAAAADRPIIAEPLPGPAPEQFNVGQRQADLIDRLGEQAVDDFEQRAFRSLAAWASEHLRMDHRSGLPAAGLALEQAGRGQVDPLTTVVIAPQEA